MLRHGRGPGNLMRRTKTTRWRRPVLMAALMLGLMGGLEARARPAVWMIPPVFDDGKSLRALFEDPAGWAQTRRHIDGIGYTDNRLADQFSEAELRAWLPQIARWHLKFGLDVGALKPWGLTGDLAFAADRKKWDRFIAAGAHLDSIAMDEPLSFARTRLQQSVDFAAEQTARFYSQCLEHDRFNLKRSCSRRARPGFHQARCGLDAFPPRRSDWAGRMGGCAAV